MMKRIILLLFMLVSLSLSAAPTVATADSAYNARNYAEAARQYQVLVDSIPSADLYYNLGNAEYRLKHFSQSVLAYQRALRIAPDHADAQYNLAVVRSRLADHFCKPSEMFFVSWFKQMITSHSVAGWVKFSFCSLLLFFVFIGIYLFTSRLALRKVGFFAAIVAMLLFLLSTAFALVQRHHYYHNVDAVITAEEVELYTSPTLRSKKVRSIHEGTTVTIVEQMGKSWIQVQLPDHTSAWMEARDFETVAQ